ncbi:hypothetical protein B0T20DRAFT_425044 [Sordaria brevicollis]|uniref:Uncharacterized protein n=1 Tax=Sordaria brevicollis TaxID=83679 RepID=A0AAE0NWL9_SORBR|nr:hypothetical protein B0T20DRAFT_425044 [Sordaria brevicollis]
MATTIPTYRYQYRQPSSSAYLPSSRFSLTPPRNTLPHTYLESPISISASLQEKIIIRQVGGPGDNHVQWVSVTDLVPYYHPSSEPASNPSNHGNRQSIHNQNPIPTSTATNPNQNRIHTHRHQTEPISLISLTTNNNDDNENGTHDDNNRKRRPSRSDLNLSKRILESGQVSRVHGVVHTANWVNDVGDRLWLRSDQPIIKGRRSVPVVNLDKGISAEVCINHVNWLPQKRDVTSDTTITFIGAEYRHRGGEPFRMCIIQDHHSSDDGGIIDMISLEELETCFEDVDVDVVSVMTTEPGQQRQQQQKQIPLPLPVQGQPSSHPNGPQRPKGPRPMPTSPVSQSPAPTHEYNDVYCPRTDIMKGRIIFRDDEDDDTLSQASFTSSMSTKSKAAIDLVAQSLSIFNFNAAMLDLAALSNQSNQAMSGFIRDVDERPEASEDDSDEEDDGDDEEGREEKAWSDCESIHSSAGRSIICGKDEDKNDRSRVEDSGSRREL